MARSVSLNNKPSVWSIAGPSITVFMLSTLAGMAIIKIVADLGAPAIAAVTAGQRINFILVALLMGMGAATTALVSRAWGAGDKDQAIAATRLSMKVGLSVCALLSIAAISLAEPLTHFFQLDELSAPLAVSYVRLLSLFAVAQGVVMILSTAFRATGDAKTPLIVSSLANIISVLAAYGFAYGAWGLPNMGVNGAAIGAGLALTLSSLCYLLLWMSNRLSLPYSYSCAAPTISMGRFLNICLPATVEQLIMQGGMLLFIGFVASYGTSTFVAFGIGFNLFSITMVIGLGFSIATSALVGQSQGAGDEQAVFDHIRQALSLSVSSMLVIGILSGLFATQLASIIIDNAEVIEIAAQFLLVLAVLQPLLAIEFVLAGAMRGAGYTGFPLVAGIATLLGVRLPLGALVIELQLPVPWLFSVFIVDQAVKVALIYWRFRQKSWLRLS